MDGRITLRFDGGSRGNPGPAGVGVVLEADDATPVVAFGKFLGVATSNVAEYRGLIAGLEQAKKLGVKHLRVLGDSELVIKQLLGQYRVRNEALIPLFTRAMSLLKELPRTEIGHNRRHNNALADALANLAMDKKRDVTDDELPGGGVSLASSDATDSTDSTDEHQTSVQPTDHECPRCNCRIHVTVDGEVPATVRRFICRCGTPMRPKQQAR